MYLGRLRSKYSQKRLLIIILYPNTIWYCNPIPLKLPLKLALAQLQIAQRLLQPHRYQPRLWFGSNKVRQQLQIILHTTLCTCTTKWKPTPEGMIEHNYLREQSFLTQNISIRVYFLQPLEILQRKSRQLHPHSTLRLESRYLHQFHPQFYNCFSVQLIGDCADCLIDLLDHGCTQMRHQMIIPQLVHPKLWKYSSSSHTLEAQSV